MQLVLDSNEYIFVFGIYSKPASTNLLDALIDHHSKYSIRIPRIIVDEVSRNLTYEEQREFIEFINELTTIDEDFFVPFELGAKYESQGLKSGDAFIAAYVEWTGAEILVTENRHFLGRHTSLPFKILNAEKCLKLIKSLL